MKIDPEVKKELIENLKIWRRSFNKSLLKLINQLNPAKTVEDVMKTKLELLKAIIDWMPFGPETCYFCLLNIDEVTLDQDCKYCLYGEQHGICPEEASDYQKIKSELERFRHILNELYYNQNEQYEV